MQPTHYIDCRNENITTEEAIALYKCEARPYPALWYQTEKSFITQRNAAMWFDRRDCLDAIASGEIDSDEIDWSELSCPLHRWQYLCTSR
jgi:hypothetical protein